MVSKGTGIIIVGGIAVVAVAAYLFLKGGGQAGGGLLGGGGIGQANPTAVQAPVSVTPSSLFSSTPSLSTGGSGTGNFTLQQTYSPYYSTSNTYTNNTTQTTTNTPQVSLKVGLWQ